MHELGRRIRVHLPAGPEGFLSARCHRLVSHDPTLRAIFEDEIALYDVMPSISFGRTPRLIIAPTFTRDINEAPGLMEERPVEITIRILYDATHWEAIYNGPHPSDSITSEEATVADLTQYIEFLFRSRDNRELSEGNEKMVQPGLTRYEPIPYDPVIFSPEQAMIVQDLRITFTVRIDKSTGQIDNLAIARA